MARMIEQGAYAGHPIRRARKRHWCDGTHCTALIEPGSLYVEGFVDPDRAGGFGHDRLCAACVDDAARAALAKARAALGE